MDQQQNTPGARDHQQIVARTREAMADYGLSQAEVARQADMSPTVLSEYLSGSYRGNVEEAGRKLAAWREVFIKRQALLGEVDHIGDFAQTSVATVISTVLNLAQMGRMVMIAGASGVGKTMALRHFQQNTPNVYYCQFSPDTKSAGEVLTEIAHVIGIQRISSRPAEIRRSIVARIERTRAVILCDEAQHLPPEGFEAIRTLHDRTGVGIVFAGHLDLADKIAKLPQVSGRILAPLRISGAKAADADALFQSWGLECKASRKFLREKAQRTKALRNVAATYTQAKLSSLGQPDIPFFEHVTRAWAIIEGGAQAI